MRNGTGGTIGSGNEEGCIGNGDGSAQDGGDSIVVG